MTGPRPRRRKRARGTTRARKRRRKQLFFKRAVLFLAPRRSPLDRPRAWRASSARTDGQRRSVAVARALPASSQEAIERETIFSLFSPSPPSLPSPLLPLSHAAKNPSSTARAPPRSTNERQPVSLSAIDAPPAPPKKPANLIQRYSKEFLLKFIGVSCRVLLRRAAARRLSPSDRRSSRCSLSLSLSNTPTHHSPPLSHTSPVVYQTNKHTTH